MEWNWRVCGLAPGVWGVGPARTAKPLSLSGAGAELWGSNASQGVRRRPGPIARLGAGDVVPDPFRQRVSEMQGRRSGAIQARPRTRVPNIGTSYLPPIAQVFGLELRRQSLNGQQFSAGHLTVTTRAVGQPDNEAEDAKRLMSQSSA